MFQTFPINSKQPQFPKIYNKKNKNNLILKPKNTSIPSYQKSNNIKTDRKFTKFTYKIGLKIRDYLVLSGQSLTIPNEERATNESNEQQGQALRSF